MNEYTIKPNSYTAMVGSFIASHVISDSLIFLCYGIGCKAQMPNSMVNIDLVNQTYTSRMGWSEFDEEDYIEGNMKKIYSAVLGQLNRYDAGFMPVTISPVFKLLGLDIKGYSRYLADEFNAPIEYVEMSGADSAFWEGYVEVMRSFSHTIDWTRRPQKGVVNIWGYPFDRYENEHNNDVKVLRKMVASLGLEAEAVFFSGDSSENLRKANQGQCNIILPHASTIGSYLQKTSNRPSLFTDIPFGPEGTERWLKKIARVFKKEMPAEFTTKKAEVMDQFHMIKERLKGRKAILILDLPWVGSFARFMTDLGIEIETIIVKDGYYGKPELAKKMIEFYDIKDPDATITDQIDYDFLYELAKKKPDIVVGASPEIAPFKEQGIPTFTFGFPSYDQHHEEEDASFLGLEGALFMTQKIENAMLSRKPIIDKEQGH